MILYEYKCRRGHRFEHLAPPDTEMICSACGTPAHRLPGGGLVGHADPGPDRAQAPASWRATGNGDRDTIRHWHQVMTRRQRLETQYPELAGDRRPVLAHEGPFAAQPLRMGDRAVPGDS